MATETTEGKNHLANDSKLGLWAAGAGFVVFDSVLNGVLDALTSIDTSGWSGWWTGIASAALAAGVGAVTAYKAKREKRRPSV